MVLHDDQKRSKTQHYSTVYNNEENKEMAEWARYCLRLGVSAALHPFEYSKVLIQLGYEPISPIPGKSILGRPILALPNIFQYAGHIRRVDGFYGCYRGLTPKLVGSVFSMVLSEKIAYRMGLMALDEPKHGEALDNKELYIHFKANLKRDIVLSVTGIVAAHPFHVISLRMMSQFIGKEKFYTSIVASIMEIYRNEGIRGFFSGIIPKLIGDLLCLIVASSTVYVVNKYIVHDKNGRQYSAGFIQFTFSNILYPLSVVSTCMAVTGCRLLAGQPPIMPVYKNWIDCLSDLYERGELKRGNSIFWRTATGIATPTTYSGRSSLAILSKYH